MVVVEGPPVVVVVKETVVASVGLLVVETLSLDDVIMVVDSDCVLDTSSVVVSMVVEVPSSSNTEVVLPSNLVVPSGRLSSVHL